MIIIFFDHAFLIAQKRFYVSQQTMSDKLYDGRIYLPRHPERPSDRRDIVLRFLVAR